MPTARSKRQIAIAAGLAAAAICACAPTPTGVVSVVSDTAVEFTATVAATEFTGAAEMAGYHFIVWEHGAAADHSLLLASVSDEHLLDALENLGARPGDTLGIDSWDERNDADADAPDRFVAGPEIRIDVLVPGADAPLGIDDILEDPGARGFEMRFGGHRANIPEWHSGCLVCLYSCPGSKVGNARYTVRDFVQGTTHFAVRPGALPVDGTTVTVRLTLVQEPVA